MMRSNITMLSELPDIDEIESPLPHERTIRSNQVKQPYNGAMLLPEDQVEKHGKFVRGTHMTPKESGMVAPYNTIRQNTNLDSDFYAQSFPNYDMLLQQQEQQPVLQQEQPIFYQPPQIISCIDTAQHCTSCPVCSRLYNSDKTIYIVIIVILSMFCLILTKKVLDV